MGNNYLTTTFQSLYTDLEALKRAALYFDKIYIVLDRLIIPAENGFSTNNEGENLLTDIHSIYTTLPDDVEQSLDVLKKEGVIEYIEISDQRRISHFEMIDKFHEIFCTFDINEIMNHREVQDIINDYARIRIGDPIENLFQLARPFSFLSANLYYSILENNSTVLTDSELLRKLMNTYHVELSANRNKVNVPKLNHNVSGIITNKAMELNLPNLDFVSFEEILEARLKLKSELEAFRTEVTALSTTVKSNFWTSDLEEEVEKIVLKEINTSINELNKKIKGADSKFLLNLLKNAKNPSSYIPLVTTIFTNIPSTLGVLTSLGLITAETIMENRVEKNNAKIENGFSYLFSLKNITSS